MELGKNPTLFRRCSNCQAELSPGVKQCPACRAPATEEKSQVRGLRRVLSWRDARHVMILLLLVIPYLPRLVHTLRLHLDARVSSLISAAVERANSHKEAIANFGEPIIAGWSITGTIDTDETGWSEARLRISVAGKQQEGTLYARAG